MLRELQPDLRGHSRLERTGRRLRVRVTTSAGTRVTREAPPRYHWADPRYEVAYASIVSCCRDVLRGLRGRAGGETTGDDNLKTLALVFGAYDSARTGRALTF
jgi:predicted dehydrogenase